MRRRNLKGLTLKAHQQAGVNLLHIQNDLNALFGQIAACYPKGSRVVRSACAAHKKVLSLRHALEDIMIEEQADSENLGDVYFPPRPKKVE